MTDFTCRFLMDGGYRQSSVTNSRPTLDAEAGEDWRYRATAGVSTRLHDRRETWRSEAMAIVVLVAGMIALDALIVFGPLFAFAGAH